MSDSPSKPPSRGFAAVIGLVLIATAVRVFYVGATHPAHFHAPAWVAFLLGVVFLAGGAQVLAIAFGRKGSGVWVAFIFFAGIAGVFWWIAIGSDPHECLSAIGPIILPGRVCKAEFGFGAAFSTALAFYFARRLFPGSQPKSYY